MIDQAAGSPRLPDDPSVPMVLVAIADTSTEAVVAYRPDGTVIVWNLAAERLYGWAADQIVGHSIDAVVPAEHRVERHSITTRTLAGASIELPEAPRVHKTGSKLRVSLTSSPVRTPQGSIIACLEIGHDIGAQPRRDELNARLAEVVESAQDAVMSFDLNERVTTWNHSAERLYGHSTEETIGRHYSEILAGSELEDFRAAMTRVAAGETVDYHASSRHHRDGTTTEVSICITAIRSPDDSIVGASAIVRDISGLRQRETDLLETLRMLERTQQAGRIGGWFAGLSLHTQLKCTAEIFKIFGTVDRPNMTLADAFNYIHPDDVPKLKKLYRSAKTNGGHFELEHRIVRPDKAERWVLTAVDGITDDSGTRVELAGVVQDITERHQAEQKTRRIETQLRMFADNSRELIFHYRVQPTRGFEFVSPASLAITGYTPEEFYADPNLGDRLTDRSSGEPWLPQSFDHSLRPAVDLELLRKDGTKLWVNQSLYTIRGDQGEIVGVYGTTSDISARKAAELLLEHKALHDPLTGLPNRVLLVDRLKHSLWRAERGQDLVAVLFVDLDRFKVFNDSRGHRRGDSVLIAVGNRLLESSRTADTVGRSSGDQFIVICEHLTKPNDAIRIANSTLHFFDAPFRIDGEDVHVTTSIGIALGKAGDSPEIILREADLAMYQAKEHGRARCEMFDETLRTEAERRSNDEAGMRRALENDEFQLVFQPEWLIPYKTIVGAEALLRWQDPERGPISPVDFIPVAEECGMIIPIGKWVLEQACKSLARVNQVPGRAKPYSMSVNVSAVQLRSGTFIEALQDVIAKTGIDPRLLCLEITESVLMADVGYFSRILGDLRDIGARLSIDDFGTGYSSLAYLSRFPVDELKIDRSFVSNLGSDPYDTTVVAAMITMGRALGLRVVAEGVATDHEFTTLRDLGCEVAQGFLFSRPIALDEYLKLLQTCEESSS